MSQRYKISFFSYSLGDKFFKNKNHDSTSRNVTPYSAVKLVFVGLINTCSTKGFFLEGIKSLDRGVELMFLSERNHVHSA